MAQYLIRRLAKAAPSGLAAFVKAARASRSGSAILELPSARSVLVVGAHPDDETALAGGTIALLTSKGTRVVVVVATAGEATQGGNLGSERVRVARQDEARAACAILGAEEPVVLDYPDGRLSEHIVEFAGDLQSVIARERPDVLIAPWWLDDHPDHRAVARAVAELDLPDSVEVWFGEIWTPLVPNRIVDITDALDAKREAIAAHATARAAFDLSAFLGLNRYRSARGMQGSGYAEAFLAGSPSMLRALVADSDA